MIYFGRWRIVSLTPGLSCIQASGEGDDRVALYKAFTAASVLLAHIKKEAMKLVINPPSQIERSSRILPPISSLHDPTSDTHIKFTILELFSSTVINRHLYIAKMIDGKKILVKFTRQYSYDLHTFCAKLGCAPPLLGFQRLPGGFFGIAMEFINDAVQISDSPYVEKHREWVSWLEELVKSFHKAELVHGDLRSPNIICNKNGPMVIDFDWAGKVGEVSYPPGPLNPELTDGRESNDLKITKDDDLRVLHKTLKDLQLE